MSFCKKGQWGNQFPSNIRGPEIPEVWPFHSLKGFPRAPDNMSLRSLHWKTGVDAVPTPPLQPLQHYCDWIQLLAAACNSCVTLDKLFKLSTELSHMQNKVIVIFALSDNCEDQINDMVQLKHLR